MGLMRIAIMSLDIIPPISGYHSFPDVLLYIPEAMRAMEGLKIAFSTGANTWTNYQCINASVFTGSNGG